MAKQCLAVTSEPSRDRVRPDVYRAFPLIGSHWPEYAYIGGYATPAIKVREPVNAPGVLRDDFVGHLYNQWDAPSTIWWARTQGSAVQLVGGSVQQPLPSYSAVVMNETPPPANRAAFSAAVQRFLATRGFRAGGSS
jgi:hypothetical protein